MTPDTCSIDLIFVHVIQDKFIISNISTSKSCLITSFILSSRLSNISTNIIHFLYSTVAQLSGFFLPIVYFFQIFKCYWRSIIILNWVIFHSYGKFHLYNFLIMLYLFKYHLCSFRGQFIIRYLRKINKRFNFAE